MESSGKGVLQGAELMQVYEILFTGIESSSLACLASVQCVWGIQVKHGYHEWNRLLIDCLEYVGMLVKQIKRFCRVLI